MMSRIQIRMFIVLLLTCVMGFAGVVHATSMTQTQAFGPLGLPVNSPGFALTFNQFDPTMGTLDSVDLKFTANEHILLNIFNISPSARTVTFGVISASVSATSLTTPATDIILNGPVDLSLSAGFQQLSVNLSDMNAMHLTSGLGPYQGGGNFQVFIQATEPSVFTNDRMTTVGVADMSLSGSFEIDYNYTLWEPAQLPEPASLLLLGTGILFFLGYGWARRRHAVLMSPDDV